MGLTQEGGRIYIITGWRGSGKTRLCTHLAERQISRGWDVAGIICPPVLIGGRKVGISARNLRSGEIRPLARLVASSPVEPCFRLGRWSFDPSTMEWGNDILTQAAPCDMLVVDELGPLELQHGEGWRGALDAINNGKYRLALVVVRPELLEALPSAWHIQRVITVGSLRKIT